MKKEDRYTDAPKSIGESLDRAVVIPNFAPLPEQVKALRAKRTKKQVSIYLTVETIEKFKNAAKENGGRYQSMISDVLDTYSQRYM